MRILDIIGNEALIERPATDDDFDDEGLRITQRYCDYVDGQIRELWPLSEASSRWPHLIPSCEECGEYTGCDCGVSQ
jgi:hypothetical protein